MNLKTFVRSVFIAVLVAHPARLWSQEAGKAGPATAPAGTNTATVTMEVAGMKLTGILNADGTFTVKMPDGTTTTLPAPDPKTMNVKAETPVGAVILNGTVNADGSLTVQMPDGSKKTIQKGERAAGDHPQVFSDAEAAKAAAQKRAEEEESQRIRSAIAKDQCDGLREKIRTLQNLLRKRQEEPASPKQDLETIRKQIDDLLNRVADCPKQEPIDAQFDCLKSKFPELQRSLDKKDTASDPASQRDFAWQEDKQAWIDTKTQESICPPSGIDPCLVGTWECTSFKEGIRSFTGGGTGFRVTFNRDGAETVDYSSMQATKAGPIDMIAFTGTASARISTDKGAAKIEAMQTAGVSMTLNSTGRHLTEKWPGLGPGGLGSVDKSSYTCSENSLEYQTSTRPDQHANTTVKLTRVKPKERK